MPRQDWFDDDTATRERSDRPEQRFGNSDRGGREQRDRGFFGSGGRDYDDRGGRSPTGSNERGRDRSWNRDSERSSRDREDRRFGPDDHSRGIPMDETERLIASNKVEGTPVFDRHEDKLGTIHNFMVDKFEGRVVYAVLKHGGGFLGLNERYYPIEWDQLTYDTRLGGYHIRIDEEDLKSFGSFDREGRWQSRSRGGRQEGGSDGRERERHRGRGDERGGRGSRNPW